MSNLEPRVPRAIRVQGRNLPFDALAAVCEIDTRNQTQVKRLTFALKRIRGYFFEEVGVPDGVTPVQWETALAKAILARGREYRERFPHAELTPTALEAWWHQLTRPARAPRSPTAEELAQRPSRLEEVERTLGIDRHGQD